MTDLSWHHTDPIHGIAQRAAAQRAIGRMLITVGRIFATLSRWRKRAMQRRALANLDAHLLRDIGITRDGAERECAKPFWR